VGFERRLRSYLESLAGRPTVVRLRHIDPTALYDSLLVELRHAETRIGRTFIEETVDRVWIHQIHDDWSPTRVALLAAYLETVSSSLAPTDPAGALRFATRALVQAASLGEDKASLVDSLELRRIVDPFRGSDVARYAIETQLVRRPHSTLALSSLGRAFLPLRGSQAIRWLLSVEVAQSTGAFDPWRTWRGVLERALEPGGIPATIANGREHIDGGISSDTCGRLCELDVLIRSSSAVRDEDEYAERYEVNAGMAEIVRGVLEPGTWQAAVATLLEDESAEVLPPPGIATTATSELTRLITHEVRNALVPVRYHIDALRAARPTSANAGRIEKARRGVTRVLAFVDELVATNELVGEPISSCDVADVLQEAVSWTDGAERVQVVAESHRVRAPRSRLVRAVANVILNALQATPVGTVRASVRADQRTVELVVDDAGEGIASELRATVFDDGYTTRSGPGHGFGLAFVRSVVEGALRGKVWCEASELGGAKFVLSIPAEPKP
jgi:signal transduction histidine kinase